MTFLFGFGWILLVAFLLWRAVRQFRAYQVLTPGTGVRKNPLPPLSVVVPARNEAGNIERCVDGLVAQDYPGWLQLIVVDDGSTDGTADIARLHGAGRDRFRVIPAGELPDGWVGKSHACLQGVRQADGDWLCFLDADTRPRSRLLRTAVALAEEQGLDMLSLEPEQELGSFWERVILPAGMFMMAFFIIDLKAVNDPRRQEAAANGQFILIRRKAYETIGGHAAVRDEISEDLALVRRAKAAHCSTLLMGTRNLLGVRMYHNLGEIWEGLSKNAVNQVNSRGRAALIATGGFLFAWAAVALPIAAFLVWSIEPGAMTLCGAAATALGSLALFLIHMTGARYFRANPGYGLLFPVGYTLIAAIVFNNIRIYRKGSVLWKGRRYVPPDRIPGTVVEGDPACEEKPN
jgi:chlorobactene glucosyltransferase